MACIPFISNPLLLVYQYTILLNSLPEPCEVFNDEIVISGELPFNPIRLCVTAKDTYFDGYTVNDNIMIHKISCREGNT